MVKFYFSFIHYSLMACLAFKTYVRIVRQEIQDGLLITLEYLSGAFRPGFGHEQD